MLQEVEFEQASQPTGHPTQMPLVRVAAELQLRQFSYWSQRSQLEEQA